MAFTDLVKKAMGVSILDVFQHYKIVVKNNKARCLWHDDKTPSVHIYVKSNKAHCFACSRGIFNAIDVVMLKENLEFVQAALFLINHFVVNKDFVCREKRKLDQYYFINDDVREIIKQKKDISIIAKYMWMIDLNNEKQMVMGRLYKGMMAKVYGE
jgi:DNA primase